MKIKGSNIILECLKEQGVDTVFGYPGGQIMPLYDALYDYRDDIDHVLTSHEQGATHAADGYARSTGRVGVAFATSGPGATNTVTGIATAFMDSVPLVVITGQVPLALIGRDSFQEVDIYGVTIPVTKHNFFVSDISELADDIRQAFRIAKSGRPGPVLIDVPKDIMQQTYEYEPKPAVEKDAVPKKYEDEDLEELAEMINRAERPLLYAGGGVITAEASARLTALAEKADIPVVSTLMNLGAISRESIRCRWAWSVCTARERRISPYTNCDLLIAVGARFSDRVTGNTDYFAQGATIAQIDIDDSEIDKNVIVDLPLIGDMNEILDGLLEARGGTKKHAEWTRRDRFVPRAGRRLPEDAFRAAEYLP